MFGAPKVAAVALAATAAGVIPAILTTGPAGAQTRQAYVVHYKDLPAHYVDDALCQYSPYNFNVQTDGSDHVTVVSKGDVTKTVDKFRGIVTGPNGKQLTKSEDATITDDSSTGNETWTGVAEEFDYTTGHTLAKDVGTLVFDSNGTIIEEHGPHPIADGPGNDAVCSYLGS